MKPLLPLDSPKYLRRLVRALNAEAMRGNGFYSQLRIAPGSTDNWNIRCNQARLVMIAGGYRLDVHALGRGWIPAETLVFGTSYGQSIEVSRQP